MSRYLLLSILCLGLLTAQAQVNDNAIGVRFGSGGGISYQHGFNRTNRLELDLGARGGEGFSFVRLATAYHWVFELSKGLNFFLGPAVTVGNTFLDDKYKGNGQDGIFIYIGGQLGAEYNLQNLPVMFGIDLMPQYPLVKGYDSNLDPDPAFFIRYVF
ncbi:MAG: hypothetical protein R2794_03165 [Chitinophagales bacterium]